MRGGCWDAGQAVEEIAAVIRSWAAGEMNHEQALEELRAILYRCNFGELLDEEPVTSPSGEHSVDKEEA